MSQFYVTVLGSTDLTHAADFVLSCLSPGVVITQDVSGSRTNCYEIIAMNLKGIGWRNYYGEYLPATPHAKSFPWVSCQDHILSINCHLQCLFSAVHQIPVCSCSCEGFCNKLRTCSSITWYLSCLLPISIPAVLISSLQGEVGDHFFLRRHLIYDIWVQLSWGGCSSQVKIWRQFGTWEEGQSGKSWFSFCVVSFFLR